MRSFRASFPGVTRRIHRLYQIVAFVFLCGAFAAPARAGVQAWGCLLYASNDGKGIELPSRLAGYESRLRRSLGYSNYRIVAQREIDVENRPDLLVSAGDIHVLLTGLSLGSDGKYLVGLLLVEGNQPEMETEARVGRGSPLFIRGPDWRDGQIIIVVEVAE
jgi:hypothetical protein